MSETILGILIGGFLGIVGSLIVAGFDYKKWKKTEKINILRKEEERLEKRYDEEKEKSKDASAIAMMSEPIYSTKHIEIAKSLNKIKDEIKKEVDNF
jgi:gas vesicle protein